MLGVTKKKTSEMVGNSVQLSNKDVSSPVNLSLDQALQGKASGVTGFLKVTRKLTDRLNFEGSVNGSWVSQYPIMENGANLNNPYALRFLGSPWANPYNPDGSYNLTSFEEMTSLNNYPYLVEKDLMNQNLLRGLVNTKVDYEILKRFGICY